MSDDDDFGDRLNELLEDFRRKKHAQQALLIDQARQDGRPFSAPAASPGCAAIRRRTEGDKKLKDEPPGAQS